MKQQEEEEERKRQRREKKKEKQQREKAPSSKEDLGDEFDLEMATMMGFDGFTSSKK
jgi:hypothetical protein